MLQTRLHRVSDVRLALGLLLVFSAVGTTTAEQIAPGVVYETRSLSNPLRVIHILEVDLAQAKLVTSPGDASKGFEYVARTPLNYVQSGNLIAAVNGGFFSPFRSGEDYYPKVGDGVDVLGKAISAGQVVSPIEFDDARVNAILCIDAVMITIEQGQDCDRDVNNALAAGPQLLSNWNTVRERWDEGRHPRTAIGLSEDGQTAFLVVVDGRQPGVSEGATYQDLVDLFVELGAANAMNLDGGGSSAMAARGPNGARLLSVPIHNNTPGLQRPSANHIGVTSR